MADQVAKLTQKGIPATLLGSAQKSDVSKEIKEGQYRLIFTTPESLYNRVTQTPQRLFVELAESGMLCLLAIDEAHLLESWKTFRYVLASYHSVFTLQNLLIT